MKPATEDRMQRLHTLLLACSVASTIAVPGVASCDWTTNGTPVGNGAFDQTYSQIASDGNGGAILIWGIQGGLVQGSYAIGVAAQRLDRDGLARWQDGGTLVTPDSVGLSKVLADGFGGAIVLWTPWHQQLGQPTVFAQRYDHDGTPLWEDGGLVVTTDALDFVAVADGTGGAIVVTDDASDSEIAVRRYRADGSLDWVERDRGSTMQWGYLDAVSDGEGGVIYANHEHAQRVDASGLERWGSNGVPFSSPLYRLPQLVADGFGGAVLTWRGPGQHVYGQRLRSTDGERLWGSRGVLVAASSPSIGEEDLALDGDGTGGAIFAWTDHRGTTPDVYAQRVDGMGGARWTTNGIPVCSGTSWKEAPVVVSDSTGGAILAWNDRRSGYEIVAQRVDSSGVWMWNDGGIVVAQGPDPRFLRRDPNRPKGYRTSDGNGGALLTWTDGRAGDFDVYASPALIDRATPACPSLVRSRATTDRVELTWCCAQTAGPRANVWRRTATSSWTSIASITADGAGLFSFTDHLVLPGASYRYRLGWQAGHDEVFGQEIPIDVRGVAEFRLKGPGPNPASADSPIAFSLADAQPAWLEILDVTGRSVARREVGSLGTGDHLLGLDPGRPLSCGVYFVRLSRAGWSQTVRMVIVD